MNHTNIATIADALALHVADITAFAQPVEGASIVEAMALAGTLDLTAVEGTATMDDFCRDRAEFDGFEEEIDWIGVISAAHA